MSRRPEARASREDRNRVQRYLEGDAGSITEISGWIRSVLHARYPVLRDVQADLIQRVHEKLIGSLRSGRFESRSSLRTYVTSITHHAAIDRIRKRHPELPLEADPGTADLQAARESPYVELLQEERSRLMHAAVARSPEECRRLWRLVFLEELSYQQVAEVLGVPPGTVKSRMWHCRRKVWKLLRRLERFQGGRRESG